MHNRTQWTPYPVAASIVEQGKPVRAVLMKVVIDGRFVLDEADLHRRLAGAFGYDPLYRHDLGSLTAHLAAGDPRPVQLTWIHTSTIRMAIGTATFDELVGALKRIEAQDEGKDWPQRFVFRLFD